MSAALPGEVRTKLREQLWAHADSLKWRQLSDAERAKWYQNWTKDPEVGGKLAHFMDPRMVRVYIKDSLLKPYLRSRSLLSLPEVLQLLEIDGTSDRPIKTYTKPEGRLLQSRKVICWGSSREWKLILIAVFERAYCVASALPFAAVLYENGATSNPGERELVEAVAQRLGILRVLWKE